MTDIVKKLAEQAVQETQQLMIMHFRDFESQLYQRFAELIVNECITACEAVEADTEMDSLSDGALCCIIDIKEKFGVKMIIGNKDGL